MNLLPFGKLAAHRPRTFVPQDINLGDWPQIAPLFDQLEVRAARATDAVALERWLIDWSELNAALDEEASRRYIAMTCHTDNADAEKAYLHFVEHVEPQLKPRQFALEKIYVAHPQRAELLQAGDAPSSRPSPPVGEKVAAGRMRGQPLASSCPSSSNSASATNGKTTTSNFAPRPCVWRKCFKPPFRAEPFFTPTANVGGRWISTRTFVHARNKPLSNCTRSFPHNPSRLRATSKVVAKNVRSTKSVCRKPPVLTAGRRN